MITKDLVDYIDHQKNSGKSEYEIKNILLRAGWSEQDVNDALSHHVIAGADVPIPPQFSGATYTHGIDPNELASPSDLLQNSWNRFKRDFGTLIAAEFAPLILALTLVLLGVGLLAAYGLFAQRNASPLAAVNIAFTIIFGILAVAAFIALVIASVWSHIAMIEAIRSEEHIGWREAFRRAWGKNIGYYGTQFLAGLVIVGGLILLVIPGFIFGVWFSFVQMIVVVEGVEGWAALQRSKSYVKGRFWKIFGRQLVVMLIAFGFMIPAFIFDVAHISVASALYRGIFDILFVPFVVAYSYSLYVTARDTSGVPAAAAPVRSKSSIFFFVLGIILTVGMVVVLFAGVVSVHVARHDKQRLYDVGRVSTALHSYKKGHATYPDTISLLVPQYIDALPQPPSADGDCTDQQNQYTYTIVPGSGGQNFRIGFCLGTDYGGFKAGMNYIDATMTAPM